MSAENVCVVYDRRKKAGLTGAGMLEIRVYLGKRVRKYYSIGKATPRQWKKVAACTEVINKVKMFQRILNAMEVMGEAMTIGNLDRHVKEYEAKQTLDVHKENEFNGYDQNQSFLAYMQNQIDNEELASGTRRNKLVVLASLKMYGKIKTFADLTPKNIFEYDQWLHDGTRTDATIKGYHKKVHKYTKQLSCCKMIPLDPYDQVHIKSGRSKEREPLTENQLVLLRNMKPVDKKMEHALDLFLFSCYTGLAYCDVRAFNFKTMTIKEGNLYYIDGKRIKTTTKFFTPILSPAMDVLKKYKFQLPKLSNQKENDYLKLVKAQIGIPQNLTFHVARHTFATLVLSHDVPIDNVARMLGHTNIRTTQIYAKLMKSTIERNSEKVNNGLK